MRHSVEALYEIKEDHVDPTTDVKNTPPLVNGRNKLGLTRESFLETILVLGHDRISNKVAANLPANKVLHGFCDKRC